ncbi:hypothetical protein, partial [Rhodovulum sulfidophilum]
RLKMTPARVSQIFSSKGANLTLKTIARIQHAIGEEFELRRKSDRNEIEKQRYALSIFNSASKGGNFWRETTANKDYNIRAKLAA